MAHAAATEGFDPRRFVQAAIAAGHCSRCKDGSGFVKHTAGRLHYGIPNLCFACDGEGTREAEMRKRAQAKEAARVQDLYTAAQERRRRVAARHPDHRTMPPMARRRIAYAMNGAPFTAAQYGAATGLSVDAAYVELCCWNSANPVIDHATGQPTGWTLS
jgi:hypothetical protein